MNKLYSALISSISDLEISLEQGEWYYIHDDLIALKKHCQSFNETNNQFFLKKYKKLIPIISELEFEARQILKKNNIIA